MVFSLDASNTLNKIRIATYGLQTDADQVRFCDAANTCSANKPPGHDKAEKVCAPANQPFECGSGGGPSSAGCDPASNAYEFKNAATYSGYALADAVTVAGTSTTLDFAAGFEARRVAQMRFSSVNQCGGSTRAPPGS